jgi:hypothetical protein
MMLLSIKADWYSVFEDRPSISSSVGRFFDFWLFILGLILLRRSSEIRGKLSG